MHTHIYTHCDTPTMYTHCTNAGT